MRRRSSLNQLRATLNQLSLEDKQDLYQWLGKQISIEKSSQPTDAEPLAKQTASVSDTRFYDGKTYQLEKRRCGKKSCKCSAGDLEQVGHGPYWYAYWKESGKLRTQYIGKRSPWQN